MMRFDTDRAAVTACVRTWEETGVAAPGSLCCENLECNAPLEQPIRSIEAKAATVIAESRGVYGPPALKYTGWDHQFPFFLFLCGDCAQRIKTDAAIQYGKDRLENIMAGRPGGQDGLQPR